MAKNPLFSNAVSPNGATAPENGLNDSYKRYKRGYNRFNLTRHNLTTERYADINPVEFVEGVEGDKLQFGIRHSIRTHTMASPIDFDLYKKMAYFLVDNKAILPINWEKVYKQPNKGDDVDDSVNTVSSILFSRLYAMQNEIRSTQGNRFTMPTAEKYAWMFRYILMLEMFFSNGSLCGKMNYHLSPMVRIRKEDDSAWDTQTFDEWLDQVFIILNDNHPFYVKFADISEKIYCAKQPINDNSDNYVIVDLRTLVDMMRTFPNFNIVCEVANPSYVGAYEYMLKKLRQVHFRIYKQAPFNYARMVAYQLVCTQFYTRDSVDYVYNAELWHNNLRSLLHSIPDFDVDVTFTYNGVKTYYDVTSGYIFDRVLNSFCNNDFTYESTLGYHYMHAIFGHRKSLRYGDYFTGAKVLPFAPGDVTADVVNNGVSALDVTRSILMQRFLNSVERVSNTWKDYLKDVTDGVAPPKDTEPRFLASTTSAVSGFEVENTGEKQGDIVTILKSSNSNYIYEVEVGSPCIIIGVSTYEAQRVYSATTDKFFYHTDRFDMFNKFMQNIGDQSIMSAERNASFPMGTSFGYQPRHMEYKQRYPIASGGFVDFLPSYAFITDNRDSEQNDVDFAESATHISPYYIRSRNSEFDRFYKNLTGVSLASYFHFQVKYTCICDAVRQMEYSPAIL